MFFKSLRLAAAMALGLGVASTANAAVFTYNLSDHPNGTLSDYSYGLRTDQYGRIFSFENGASAQLIYDDVAKTASIIGTMIQSFSDGTFGDIWTINYSLSGLTDKGNGTFKDKAGNGSGTISFGMTELSLGAKANRWGTYFALLSDGNRIPDDTTTTVGRGWVNYGDKNCCNDFLFTAELDPGDPGGVVPLPAAAWMLLSGVAGLGVMSRRRRRN